MGIWRDQVERKAGVIHSQIAAVRRLAELHGEPAAEGLYAPYLELLRTLYSDEFPLAVLLDESDLVVRFEGPLVTNDGPPAGVVTSALTQIRQQVRGVAKAIVGLSGPDNLRWSRELDPHLSGIAQGSLVIGVRVPHESDLRKVSQPHLEGMNDQILETVRSAVRSIRLVARHIQPEGVDEDIAVDFPDPALRDAVLVAARSMSPTGKRGIDRVSFLGDGRSSMVVGSLTPQSRRTLSQAISRPTRSSGVRRGAFSGVVREIDLDARRFEIRNVVGIGGGIRCAYEPAIDAQVRSLLDSTIEVLGDYDSTEAGEPRLMFVEEVRLVSRPPRQLRLPK